VKFRRAQFREECFDFDVILVWQVNGPTLTKLLKRDYNFTDHCDDDWAAITIAIPNPDGPNKQMMAFRNWKYDAYNIGTLTHESSHVVFRVLRDRGMKLNNHTQEAYAYLQDSIVRRSLQLLNRKK
jgi:hypothetical protein